MHLLRFLGDVKSLQILAFHQLNRILVEVRVCTDFLLGKLTSESGIHFFRHFNPVSELLIVQIRSHLAIRKTGLGVADWQRAVL